MTARERAFEAAGFALLLVGALGFFAWRWSSLEQGLAADQAESLLLARALVEGNGLKLTPASAFSPGPANLAWLGVQAAVLRAGLDPALWLPRLSLALLTLALVVAALRGAVVWRRLPRLEEALPVVGLAGATAAAEAAALGSGAAGWVFALSVAAVITGRGLATGRTGWAALGIGLLALFRPGAAWFIVATVPSWWIAARLEGRSATREALRFFVQAVFVAALVFGFRLVVLGALPTEGLWPSSEGAAGTLEFLARQSRWFWAALTGAAVAAVWRRFHLRGGGTLAAWVLMTVALASWGPSARALFLGGVPLLAMLVGDGLAAAREGVARAADERTLRWLSWSALGALVLLLALASVSSFTLGRIMEARSTPVARPEVREEFQRRGVREPLVAWSDGVEAAELFPEARIVVVTKPSLGVEDLLVSEGPPDLIDARVALEAMPRLASVVSPGPGGQRWLSEQSPDEDPRCPDGRLALLSTTPEQLARQLVEDVSSEQPARGLLRWRCALSSLDATQLLDAAARVAVAEAVQAKSAEFERQGRLELALRAASLAASVSGEDVQRRARAERLRERWLEAR